MGSDFVRLVGAVGSGKNASNNDVERPANNWAAASMLLETSVGVQGIYQPVQPWSV